MERRQTINKVLVLLLAFAFGLFYAQQRPSVPGNGGVGGVGPGAIPRNPIDMYEGMLLGMALLMIVGYYLYSRNRRIANS